MTILDDDIDSNLLTFLPKIIDIQIIQENFENYNCSSIDPELNYIYSLKKISNNNEINLPKINSEEQNLDNFLNYKPIINYDFIHEKENQIQNEKENDNKPLNSTTCLLPSSFSNTNNKKDFKKIFKTKDFNKKNKQKKILIKINQTKRKRGRKTNVIKEVYSHTANDSDNLLVKIHADFLNFIINLSNDALLTEFGSNQTYNFKKISYSLKKTINYSKFLKYKRFSIKEILCLEISKKYKIIDKKINEKTLNEVCKLSSWLSDFFNLNYLNFFEFYYQRNPKINKICFQNKDIILSNKTKSFNNLLLKYKDLNSNLVNIVNKLFLPGFNNKSDNNEILKSIS